ncbi:MAG: hypothetical protein Q8N81_04665 [bacterium]|nr:hypothetical protein [bacterium]
MSGILLDDKLRIAPFGRIFYSVGKPAEGETTYPQIGALETGVDLDADITSAVKFNLDGRVNLTSYQNFQNLRVLNPQLPLVELVDEPTELLLFQSKLKEAKISYYGSQTKLFAGYQKVLLGNFDFPFTPANSFAGQDYATPTQLPEPQSVPVLRLDFNFNQVLSANLIAAPSSELRDTIPFQDSLIKKTLADEGLKVADVGITNQAKDADIDALVALSANWSAEWGNVKVLVEAGHEHDHFFKIDAGEVFLARSGKLNFSADLIYPRRETVAAEISGRIGDLIYWAQGSGFYYPTFHQGAISSPLEEKTINYDQTVFQEAAGVKYYFPQQYFYIAANAFNGSLSGNGELQRQVVSLSAGKQWLNGDLSLGGLANCYFDDGKAHYEFIANTFYRPAAGLKLGLGGRVAEEQVFTLAQPVHGYLSLGYDF